MSSYRTVKYNGQHAHDLDTFDSIDDAIQSAKTLHHPDWPKWQGIMVIDNKTGKAVFDSNVIK